MGNTESATTWEVSVGAPLNVGTEQRVFAVWHLRAASGEEIWRRACAAFPASTTLTTDDGADGTEELLLSWYATESPAFAAAVAAAGENATGQLLGTLVLPLAVLQASAPGKVWLGWSPGGETPWAQGLNLARSLRTAKCCLTLPTDTAQRARVQLGCGAQEVPKATKKPTDQIDPLVRALHREHTEWSRRFDELSRGAGVAQVQDMIGEQVMKLEAEKEQLAQRVEELAQELEQREQAAHAESLAEEGRRRTLEATLKTKDSLVTALQKQVSESSALAEERAQLAEARARGVEAAADASAASAKRTSARAQQDCVEMQAAMAAVEAKARAAHEMLRLEEDRRQAADLRTAASEERAVAAEERARTLEGRVAEAQDLAAQVPALQARLRLASSDATREQSDATQRAQESEARVAALEAQLAEASSRQGAQAERLHAAEAKTAALEARVLEAELHRVATGTKVPGVCATGSTSARGSDGFTSGSQSRRESLQPDADAPVLRPTRSLQVLSSYPGPPPGSQPAPAPQSFQPPRTRAPQSSGFAAVLSVPQSPAVDLRPPAMVRPPTAAPTSAQTPAGRLPASSPAYPPSARLAASPSFPQLLAGVKPQMSPQFATTAARGIMGSPPGRLVSRR